MLSTSNIRLIILKGLKGLVVLYIFLLGLLYIFQDNLLFHPHKKKLDFQEREFEGIRFDKYKEFYIDHSDGTTINAQLIESKFDTKGVIYFLHGNRGNISSQKIDLPHYLDRGYDVFMIDYQGYGKSEGEPTKENLQKDVILGYDYLKELYVEDSITILGHSMGSYPATFCAKERNPKQLILMAPIYSVEEIITYKFPFILIPFDFRNNLDNSKQIDSINCETHIFLSKWDHTIPFKSAIKFKNHLKEPSTLTIAHSATHNNLIGDKNVIQKLDVILGLEIKQ